MQNRGMRGSAPLGVVQLTAQSIILPAGDGFYETDRNSRENGYRQNVEPLGEGGTQQLDVLIIHDDENIHNYVEQMFRLNPGDQVDLSWISFSSGLRKGSRKDLAAKAPA